MYWIASLSFSTFQINKKPSVKKTPDNLSLKVMGSKNQVILCPGVTDWDYASKKIIKDT